MSVGQHEIVRIMDSDLRPVVASRTAQIDPQTQDFRLMVQGMKATSTSAMTPSAALEAHRKYVKGQARLMREAMTDSTLPDLVRTQMQPHRRIHRSLEGNTADGIGKSKPQALQILADQNVAANLIDYDPIAVATALANAAYQDGNVGFKMSTSLQLQRGGKAILHPREANTNSSELISSQSKVLNANANPKPPQSERERVRRYRSETLDLANGASQMSSIQAKQLRNSTDSLAERSNKNSSARRAASSTSHGEGDEDARSKADIDKPTKRTRAMTDTATPLEKVVPQSPIRRVNRNSDNDNDSNNIKNRDVVNRPANKRATVPGINAAGKDAVTKTAGLPYLEEFEMHQKELQGERSLREAAVGGGMSANGRLPKLKRDASSVNDGTSVSGCEKLKGQMVPKDMMKKTGAHADDLGLVNKVPIDNTKYRYKFFTGNNGRVVLQAFRKRTWMHPVHSNKPPEKSHREVDSRPNSAASTEKDGKDSSAEPEPYELLWEMYRSPKRYKTSRFNNVVLNHIQNNACLVTKKGLFFTLRDYCQSRGMPLSSVVPRTYFIPPTKRDGVAYATNDDTEAFLAYNEEVMKRIAAAQAIKDNASSMTEKAPECEENQSLSTGNSEGLVWICKPASLTNRGYGITVLRGVDQVMHLTRRPLSVLMNGMPQEPDAEAEAEGSLDSIDAATMPNPLDACREAGVKPSGTALTKAASKRGAQEGWIVQEYIERPLLVAGRKFDIRVFVLLHLDKSKNGKGKGELQAYMYQEPYVRTSWKLYSLDDISDRECHLTNDAVQKKAKGYGMFESGNKLTMEQWQEHINTEYPGAPSNVVFQSILPAIKKLVGISVSAALPRLEKTIITKSFELLGYDFMVTEDYKPLLIEINSNPCLEFSCPLLARLILEVVNAVFRTSVDRLCPAPQAGARTKACEAACTAVAGEINKFEELELDRSSSPTTS